MIQILTIKQMAPTTNQNYTEMVKQARIGDILEDGSVVISKLNQMALIAAPKSTEVWCSWSYEFEYAFEELWRRGFTPSEWFIPTKKHMLKINDNYLNHIFDSGNYWTSTECGGDLAWNYNTSLGGVFTCGGKTFTSCVRAFRCIHF
jgi:hypothetical protein